MARQSVTSWVLRNCKFASIADDIVIQAVKDCLKKFVMPSPMEPWMTGQARFIWNDVGEVLERLLGRGREGLLGLHPENAELANYQRRILDLIWTVDEHRRRREKGIPGEEHADRVIATNRQELVSYIEARLGIDLSTPAPQVPASPEEGRKRDFEATDRWKRKNMDAE